MSRLFAFSLCLLSLTPSLASAEELKAQSNITTATVYSDRASITREAVLDIPAGAHTVSFTGLPTILFADSLRAEGSASASVKFGAVIYKQVMATQLAAPRAQELKDTLETLQDQLALLNVEKRALTAKKDFLGSIGGQATLRTNEEIAEINLKPDQWSGAAQTLYAGLMDTMTAEVQLDIKVRALNREIQKAQSELNALNADQYSSYEVVVPIESDAATRLTIDLSYQVPNASWRPIYDARLDTETGKLDLIQYGSVSQTTGEDWKGVKLVLSTAQPQRGTSLPDLTPFWLDLYSEQQFGGLGGAAMERSMSNSVMSAPAAPAMEMADMASDQRAEPVMKKAEFVAAQIETGGFVSEYKIPGPASVTADGTETKLMVGSFKTESLIQVHIKPQLSTDAFLVSKAKLKGESPVLPGQVSLFRDGAYVGQASIPLLRPDEEHVMFFGTDDQVSVKRKVLKDVKSDAGMIVRENTQERRFITEVMNLHTKPVQIVVKETVPTGRNEKIRSEILKDETTGGYEEDSANIKGLLRWEFPLEPKAKKDVKLGWKVNWPKDTNLSGL
jgi:uncharacterized protein (TIGR02231 family)